MPLPRLLLWLPDLPQLPPSQFIILSSSWKDYCKGKLGFQDAHGGDAHPTYLVLLWGPMLSSFTSPVQALAPWPKHFSINTLRLAYSLSPQVSLSPEAS